MQILTGTVKDIDLELDGTSTIKLMTERRKPLTVSVEDGEVTVTDDELNESLYQGFLVDSAIVFLPQNCYVLFKGMYLNMPTAYKLEFNMTTRIFTMDSRAIETLK
jgi:hypothetical protein